jgi:hypothetical protein
MRVVFNCIFVEISNPKRERVLHLAYLYVQQWAGVAQSAQWLSYGMDIWRTVVWFPAGEATVPGSTQPPIKWEPEPLLPRLKRPGFGAHHSVSPLPVLRMTGAVTRFLQTPLSRRGEGQLAVYTKPTATVDAYLVLSSSVYLVIAWTHSMLSNFSIWRNAFLYLQDDCQIWLYLISGLLYCFSSCSSKANSSQISIGTQLHSWALFLEDYSHCVEFSNTQQPAEGHSVDVCPS